MRTQRPVRRLEALQPPPWTGPGVAPGPAPRRRHSVTVGPTDRLPEPSSGRGVRALLRGLFWGGLGVSLALWWFGTAPASITDVPTALVEGGRIVGMLAGYLLLVQILLMSRVGWLDRRISANELLLLHRDLGCLVLVTTLAHVALLLVGNAHLDGVSLWAETTTTLTSYQDMISAFVATGLLVGVALLAIRAVRTLLPYEVWYRLHLASYAVLVLGYGHQFADGRELSSPGLGRTYWLGLYVLVIGSFGWGRVIAPIRLNLRHRLRVEQVVPESEDIFSIYIGGRRLPEMNARAGQFFRWRFLARRSWSQAHPFSLSAAPNGRWLRLTVKAVGDHTEQLRWLRAGHRVWAQGPSGVFTAARRTRHRALLIAGGSGIAPIRALIEDLPRGTVVIYRASSPDELIFREELEWLADARDSEIIYVVGSRDDPGPRRVMSTRGIRQIVPDVSRRDVYLCGPEGLITASVSILRKLRVPRRQIHLDPFEF